MHAGGAEEERPFQPHNLVWLFWVEVYDNCSLRAIERSP